MKNSSYEQFFTKAQDVKRKQGGKGAAVQAAEDETRWRQALRMKTKKRPPVPWKAVLGLVVSLFLAGVYVVSPDTYDRLFSKVEIRAMGQASAAATQNSSPDSAEKSQTPASGEEKAAAVQTVDDHGKGPADKSGVGEEVSQFAKLKQRKEELDEREKELNELEEELQRQKVELDKRITQLEEMRNQIAQTLKDRVEVDQEKVNKLVDLYSNMKPKQAADVIGSLNEELAVEVLAKMKKKSAAEIMNLLTPEKARILSEKFTGYRRISSQEPKG